MRSSSGPGVGWGMSITEYLNCLLGALEGGTTMNENLRIVDLSGLPVDLGDDSGFHNSRNARAIVISSC